MKGALRAARVATALALATMLLASCGTMPSMTPEKALATIDKVVTDTLTAAAPGVPASTRSGPPAYDENGIGPCSDPLSGNKVVAQLTKYLPQLPMERNLQIVRAIRDYWVKQGYTIDGFRDDGQAPRVFAVTTEFYVSWARASDGSSNIGGSSHCIDPSH